MSKAVLMSIQPKWCKLIAQGKKTIEIRKTMPKVDEPFKVYIYMTKKGNNFLGDGEKDWFISYNFTMTGKVIGEFICKEMTYAKLGGYAILPKSKTFVDELDLLEYANEKAVYGWHISDLVIYDEPKELSEFIRICPEWEKEEITNKCLKCEHYFISNADCFAGCDCEGELSITRPPQSWCYVEELSK